MAHLATTDLNTILTTILITLLLSKPAASDGSTVVQSATCLEAGFNANAGDTYVGNLEIVLGRLPSHAGSVSFYNTSSAQHSRGEAFAFYLCRGDASLRHCSSCVASLHDFLSTSDLVTKGCGDGFAYSVQNCLIRFANYSFIGTYKPGEFVSLDVSQANATNFAEYNRTLGALVPELIAETAFNSSAMFATKRGSVGGGGGEVYALAQCTPDISRRNCSQCLSSAFSNIRERGGPTSYAWAMLPSCQLRYDNAPFYSEASVLNPPPVLMALFLAPLWVSYIQKIFG